MDAFTEHLILSQLAHSLIIIIIKTELERGGRNGNYMYYLYFNSLFLTMLCQKLFPSNTIMQRKGKTVKSIYCL